jgi:hypothetical protein
MREHKQAIGGILVEGVGQVGSKNGLERSHDEELDNKEEG